MHGNCVFPDDDEIVKVRHQSGRSVVSGQEDQEGKVHFPLGQLWDAGTAMPGTHGLKHPGAWLRVDCGPEPQDTDKPSSDKQIVKADTQILKTDTQIVKAEVFVGCERVWGKDFSTESDPPDPPDPPKIRTFKELITPIELDIEEEGPKALGVTLTLKFGGNAIKFCSVAVYGVRRFPPGHCVGRVPPGTF